jgi:hypothetical protein
MVLQKDFLISGCGNQNVICKISGFHSGDYEELRLLGCGAV